jgi:hypothetical protein
LGLLQLQGYRLAQAPLTQQLLEALLFGATRKAAVTAAAVRTFWQRATSDDLLYLCASAACHACSSLSDTCS